MEEGSEKSLVRRTSVVSRKRLRALAKRKKEFNSSKQLATYKFVFAYSLFEILVGQKLCYFVHHLKRGFKRS